VRSREVPAAASSLTATLLTGLPWQVAEAARTRLSVHYDTGSDDLPVLCVCTPEAVRLPNAVVADLLPDGPLTVGGGRLRSAGLTLAVRRWWRPARPRGVEVRAACRRLAALASYDAVPLADLEPHALLGRGPGLTPSGDDVLAGALVTAHATDDPRLARWRAATVVALHERTTTAVSRGLLRHALDGYATDELAELLAALGAPGEQEGHDLPGALRRLLALGHSSGAALLAGVRYTIESRQLEEAA
jgi:hypothetical protein